MGADRHFWQGDTLWSRDFPITGGLRKHTVALPGLFRAELRSNSVIRPGKDPY